MNKFISSTLLKYCVGGILASLRGGSSIHLARMWHREMLGEIQGKGTEKNGLCLMKMM